MSAPRHAGDDADTVIDALTPLSPSAPGDPEPPAREFTVTARIRLPLGSSAEDARQVAQSALMRDAEITRIGWPGYRAEVTEVTED